MIQQLKSIKPQGSLAHFCSPPWSVQPYPTVGAPLWCHMATKSPSSVFLRFMTRERHRSPSVRNEKSSFFISLQKSLYHRAFVLLYPQHQVKWRTSVKTVQLTWISTNNKFTKHSAGYQKLSIWYEQNTFTNFNK